MPDLDLARALGGGNRRSPTLSCARSEGRLDAARPTADLVLPTLSEHAMGQLMQMLMLATVVEGRLMGLNPYGQTGVEQFQGKLEALLKG